MFSSSALHRRHLSRVGQLSVITILVSTGLAALDTVWSVFIEYLVGSVVIVGVVTAAFSVLSISLSLFLVPHLSRFRSRSLASWSLVAAALAYFCFAVTQNLALFLVVGAVMVVANTVRYTALSVLTRDQVSRKDLSRVESVIYGFMNVGWLLGPLIAGPLAESSGVPSVFILGGVFFVFAFVELQATSFRESGGNPPTRFLENIKEFFGVRNFRFSYVLTAGVQMWWALIYVYVPIFMVRNGMPLSWVGYFFFANSVPLVLLEFLIGKYADRIGERWYFINGFAILALAGVAAFLVPDPRWVLSVLVAASAGAALLEPTMESYFFKWVRVKDQRRFYGPYMTSNDMGSLAGKLVGATVLVFLPFRFVFLGTAGLMVGCYLVSLYAPRSKGRRAAAVA